MDATRTKMLMGQLMPALRNHPMTRQLTQNQLNTLQYLSFVGFLHGMQSQRGGIYCTPSEEHIASIVSAHRVTISRIVSSLKSCGLLNVTQRRPVDGRWQTNLYKLSKLFWSMFGYIIKRFERDFNRVASSLHLVSERSSINPKTTDNSLKGGGLKDFPYNIKGEPDNNWLEKFMERRPDIKEMLKG